MRSFTCGHCGQLVFFENSLCLRCGTPLGFVPERLELTALEGDAAAGRVLCANSALAACNWTVSRPGELCRSCRLTRGRPGDWDRAGKAAFAKAEAAKRRAVFQLLDLGLPGVEVGELTFDLLSSVDGPVTTGHVAGVITIDLAESDDARREARRTQLGEPYRTMLGHFRHELGHYYQPRLLPTDAAWAACRVRFGEDREDYDAALERHYAQGPPGDWAQRYVSAYATMHPWEDWAETFSHYLHIRDTLQTAAGYGMRITGPPGSAYDPALTAAPQPEPGEQWFGEIVSEWLPLTYALNAVNRSMGRGDLYPFTLAPAVIDKLAFVHARVQAATAGR